MITERKTTYRDRTSVRGCTCIQALARRPPAHIMVISAVTLSTALTKLIHISLASLSLMAGAEMTFGEANNLDDMPT